MSTFTLKPEQRGVRESGIVIARRSRQRHSQETYHIPGVGGRTLDGGDGRRRVAKRWFRSRRGLQ